MRSPTRLLWWTIAVCLVVAPAMAVGCGSGGGQAGATTGAGGVGGAAAGAGGAAAGAGGSGGMMMGCMGTPGIDPSKYPAGCCGKGPTHCVPSSLVPASLQADFASCAQKDKSKGLCVPDPILEKGSEYVPASCTSLLSSKGVCLSLCIPKIGNDPNAGLLPQATCGTGEVCVPCIDPLNQKSTGACELSASVCADGGAGDAGDGGMTDGGGGPTCPYTGPQLVDPKTFPACSPACGGAHCLPAALVPPADAAQLAMCSYMGGAGYCAPDTFIASDGKGVPSTCTSIAGAEGRCLSTCLPAIAAQANLLPQATCAADERCAPCFNPTAADPTAPTGACSLACDMPKDKPTVITCPYMGPPIIDPTVFPACAPACGGAHCVPAALIPAADQAQLAACPGGFCAPDSVTASAGQGVPATCKSVAGAEGRCTSTCLPAIAALGALLPVDVCGAGEVCAPCFNPAAADPTLATGACTLACDMPVDPPTILTCPWAGPPVIDPTLLPACAPACQASHCLPAAEVPAAQQAQLAACPGGFCAPDAIIATANNFIPATCTPFPGTGAPGRCVSDCIPAIGAQAALLTQQSCNANESCAPCADPFTGLGTGACSLGCDMAPMPAFTFPTCCDFNGGTQGTCVPTATIAASGQSTSSLQQDECPGGAANYLCIPEEYLPSKPIPVSTCTTLLGAGTCISQCVNITAAFLFSQDQCPDNHLCVPCSIAPMGTPGC